MSAKTGPFPWQKSRSRLYPYLGRVYPARVSLARRHHEKNLKFADSPLEGNGFELVVPREIDGGFETSSELGEPSSARRVSSEQSSASANRQSSCGGSNAATHRRMKAAKLSAAARHRGTEGSNPLPSSVESTNRRFLGGGAGSTVCHELY